MLSSLRADVPMCVRIIIFFFIIVLTVSCSNKQAGGSEREEHEHVSVELAIRKIFPGAVPFKSYTDSLLFFLNVFHHIPEDRILLGQYTCVDDVLNTKNPFADHTVKGPFNLGGLAGLPFTGITGYNAFAHHVPDKGAALIFLGPYIGYSHEEGWGKIERVGQHEATTSRGALVNAVEKLKIAGAIIYKVPAGDDYQEEVIEQFALQHKDEILNSTDPLITLTKLIYSEAEERILICLWAIQNSST